MSDAGPLKMTIDGNVLWSFFEDWSFVSIIRGPWASGKSVVCIAKMFSAANMQNPDRNMIRKTRWAVVRDSYPNLQETTIKTWLDWFPEEIYGPLRRSRPFGHVIRLPGNPWRGKPTTVEMEVVFLALAEEEDRKKLLSMEFTGAWINEAREQSKGIIDDVIGRTGRYPSKRDGGHTWAGCFMDTNAPGETHWLPLMMGEALIPETMPEEEREGLKKPEDWHYYVQPGALLEDKDEQGRHIGWLANPKAENINNLTDGFDYYFKRAGGKANSWVRVNFCNKLGQLVAGKAVWPTFEREKHVSKSPIAFDPNFELLVGFDSTGRRPAAVFGQVVRGHWYILGELLGSDTNAEKFAPEMRRMISRLTRDTTKISAVRFFRDPHMEKSQIDDRTIDAVFLKNGMRLMPAPGGNGIAHRLTTVETLFDNGRITISPICTMLIASCEGGYCYRKLKIAGNDIFEDVPDKRNGYSDLPDGLQYLVLGAGEGRSMMAGSARPQPVNVARKVDVFNRGMAVGRKPRESLFARG